MRGEQKSVLHGLFQCGMCNLRRSSCGYFLTIKIELPARIPIGDLIFKEMFHELEHSDLYVPLFSSSSRRRARRTGPHRLWAWHFWSDRLSLSQTNGSKCLIVFFHLRITLVEFPFLQMTPQSPHALFSTHLSTLRSSMYSCKLSLFSGAYF